MNRTTKAKPDEPPGFAEWWATWSKSTQFGGRREHYVQAFNAGRATRENWIDPRPITSPSLSRGSTQHWPFAPFEKNQ